MPRAGVKMPDGRVVVVEYEKGATVDEIKQLAQSKGTAAPTSHGYPVVPPESPGLVKPSVSGYLAQGAKNRAGDIGAMVGGALMPGSGLLGLAGRLGASEVGQDLGDAATGQKVTPGYGAATQLFGEGVSKAVSPLLSPKTYQAFANRTVKALTEKLDELVPSWSNLPASARGLWERAHGTGQRVLSQKFQEVISGIKNQIPETLVIRVPEVIEVQGRMDMIDKPRNAHALIDDLPSLRQSGGKPYRNALKALADQLPEGLSPELDAARGEYKNGAGWIDFAERGKFLRKERYDPEKAQDALTTWGKRTLLGRGLDEVAAIVRGPGAKPIESTKLTPWTKRISGTEVAQPVLGHGLSGLAGSLVLPSEVYRNVPLTGAQQFAGRVGKAGVAEVLREGARDFGVKDQLPGVGAP